MFSYDLPQVIKNDMQEHKFSGLINAQEVTTAWEEIRSSIERLYTAADLLEVAINRQQYNEINTISTYKQKLSQIAAGLNRSSTSSIDFNNDMERAQDIYDDRIIYPSEDGRLTLPEARSANYLADSTLWFGYRHGGRIDDNGIQNLVAGGQWEAIVYASKPVTIDPAEELYNITSGVPFWLNVTFNRPRDINCIIITPWSQFPMDLIAVHVYERDGNKQVILAPAGHNVWWQSTMLFEPTYMRFPSKTVTGVSLLMNQRHYTKNEDAFTGMIWYEYRYGLERLFIGKTEYHARGQWISTPIKTGSIISSVQLEVKEKGGFYPGSNIPASIESSVEYDVSINGRDWLPILPVGRETIEGELLHPISNSGKYRACLRFPVKSNLVIYCNYVLLKPGLDYDLVDKKTIIFHSQPLGILTAWYSPDSAAQTVNLLVSDCLTEVTEEFPGTDDSGRIILSSNIYINYNLIETLPDSWNPSFLGGQYVPVKVSIYTVDGKTITQPESAGCDGIYNITPYKSTVPVMTGQINYTCNGRIITFDKKIDNGSVITVTYQKAAEEVRIRTTLVRHNEELTSITPEVTGIEVTVY